MNDHDPQAEERRARISDALMRPLPEGIDAQAVSENDVGRLQEQVAILDLYENNLTEAANDATARKAEAQNAIDIAEMQHREVLNEVADRKAVAKRQKNEATRDEQIAKRKLDQVKSSKIGIMSILKSMGSAVR